VGDTVTEKGEWRRIERAGPEPAPLVWHAYTPDDLLQQAAEAVVDAWDNGRQYGNSRLKLPTKDEEDALREALRALRDRA
jgi:hypothetical protein